MKALLAICGLSLLAIAGPVQAGEWVYFKNGHKMLVESMREEDGIVYLKLNAGNEVGFPKALLAEVSQTNDQRGSKQFAAASGTGRGPGFNDLLGTQQVLSEMGVAQRSAILQSEKMKSGTTYSYGYSYLGSEDVSRIQRVTPTQSLRQQLRDLNALNLDAEMRTNSVTDRNDRGPTQQRPFGLSTMPKRDARRGNID